MQNKDGKNIGIYIRVSSREQAKFGYGLDVQELKCRDYVNFYEFNVNKITLYKDDGFTGRDLHRPSIKRLMNDVKNKKIDILLIYKLDRLSRSVIDTCKLIKFFLEQECQLISVMDRLDIDSANGRMLVGILAVFANWESDVISERTVDGMQAMIHKGKYPFCCSPFGWDKDDDKFLQINEEQAKIINDLGNRAIQGYNTTELKYYLKEKYNIDRGVDAIKKYLTSQNNIGLLKFHGELYKNVIPPIMTVDHFNKVKKSVRTRNQNDSQQYLFYNKVWCSCGERCVNRCTVKNIGNIKQYYYYYVCPSCHKRMNQKEIYNQCMLSVLLHDSEKEMKGEYLRKQKSLQKLNTKIEQIYVNYINDVIETDVYLETIKELKKKQKKLNDALISLKMPEQMKFFQSTKEQQKAYIDSKVEYIVVDMENNLVVSVKYVEK